MPSEAYEITGKATCALRFTIAAGFAPDAGWRMGSAFGAVAIFGLDFENVGRPPLLNMLGVKEATLPPHEASKSVTIEERFIVTIEVMREELAL